MTRSKRKTPKCGVTTAESEKWNKQASHRKTRRHTRQCIAVDPEVENLPQHDRDLTNPWSMDKDGKQRFDPEKWPEGMRK